MSRPRTDRLHGKLRGICPSCGARRMAKTAAHLVECVIPRVPARQWVLSFPIPLRSLFAVHPELLAAEPKIYSFSPKTQPPIALGNLLAIARAGLTVSDDLHYRLSSATHPYLAEPFHI